MPGPRPAGGVHRIVDHPVDHEAPGAWEWDRSARRRRDAAASDAARRFLEQARGADDCWRCEVAPAVSDLGLCAPCLDELRSG